MKNGYESKLKFEKYIVKEIKYELNETFELKKDTIVLDLDISKETTTKDKKMEVELVVEIFKNCKQKGYPFSLKMIVVGFFELEGEGDVKIYEANAIAILYPYVRSIVSTYTSAINVPQLNLPLINVNEYLENK